jgi:hypothetical protein
MKKASKIRAELCLLNSQKNSRKMIRDRPVGLMVDVFLYAGAIIVNKFYKILFKAKWTAIFGGPEVALKLIS